VSRTACAVHTCGLMRCLGIRGVKVVFDRLGLEPEVRGHPLFKLFCPIKHVKPRLAINGQMSSVNLCSSKILFLPTAFFVSDGQKRPVYIYRFLTAGAIDGR
jgi:hypothetical protein